jgi:uroporphyrinogen decarboxylase
MTTSRERFLAVLNHRLPDRVPAAPDTSNYIPARRTGLPFWEIYFEGAVPLWQAYLDTAVHFGMDAWVASCTGVPFENRSSRVTWESELVFDEARAAMLRRTVAHTPSGDLNQEELCYRHDPPTPTIKLIKHLVEDFAKYRWLIQPPTGFDFHALDAVRQVCREHDFAFGLTIGYPGFQNWMNAVQGGVQPLAEAEMDTPAVLEEWADLDLARGTREMELLLDAGLDYILFGGSGTITLASPRLARKYALPALKKWSKMAKDAGVPTMLHSCGKSMALVKMLAEETDVDLINPLEVPPMGDVHLAEVKRLYGSRIALMGNLHTTEVMMLGTPELVRQKVIEALRDAGQGGNFILSTGDQCGPLTPDANLFALVDAVQAYGRYDPDGSLPDLPL